MTGAMYASIAGLRTHMQKLSVIGNNVANVNTSGYKTQRAVFRDAMYTTYSGGSNGTAVIGGKNPSEIGYGSQIGSIDMDMSTTTINPAKPTDCAIMGDGFFLVGNKDIADTIDATNPNSFKSLTLTRVGDFEFKADNYLTDGAGSVVYGFMCVGMTSDGDAIISDQLVPIRLPRMEKVYYTIGEDGIQTEVPTDENGQPTAEYDETGYKVHYAVAYPTEDGNPATGDDAATGAAWKLHDYGEAADGSNPYAFAEVEAISIDENSGQISAILRDTGENIVIGYIAMGIVTNPNGVSHSGGSYYTCGDGAGDLRITMIGGINKDVYDVRNCTYNNGIWAPTAAGQKGMGYVNGSLVEGGDGDDVELSSLAELGSSGNSTLKVGFLEGPNVDLATEISEMITTQRGYQANTRIITITDSMLEELVNMKR